MNDPIHTLSSSLFKDFGRFHLCVNRLETNTMVIDKYGGKKRAISAPAQVSNSSNPTFQKLNKLIAGGSPPDYDSWRSMISEIESQSPAEIESQSPEDIETIFFAYDSFLVAFPLCHWHLGNYAHLKAKLCGPQEAVDIYERTVGVSMYSVAFWVDYFSFGAASLANPEDVRRLFRRAISFVDRDYFSHALWDKYMKYEFEREGWSFLAHGYIQTLRFPTMKLQFYYDNFKQFVANLEEEMQNENNKGIIEQFSVPCASTDISMDEVSLTIKDLLDSPDRSVKSKALDKYKSIGEGYYREARQVDERIRCFEKKIRRRYFYSKPLDDDEINNWHLYLDFIEKQGNMTWAMKLYERCLIPCAHYPEFWMRYVDFLESQGGRELAISALDRSTQIFVKNVPEIHLFNARFKELIGDVSGAHAALNLCDTKTDSSLIDNVVTLANLERRLGNLTAASDTYKKALKDARERQKMHVLPTLYNHFAHLTFLTTGSAAAVRDILIEGVQDIPNCRFLLEELIKFAMTHEGACQVNIIDPIIDNAISTGVDEYEGLSAKDRENISSLYLEFVDLCGTIHDIRKARIRHIKLFPQFLRIRTTHSHSTSNSSDSKRVNKGEENPTEVAAAHKIHPTQVQEKPSPQKALALSSEDELSCGSKEYELGPTVGDAVLATQSKENTPIPHEPTTEVKMSTINTDENLLEIEHAQEPQAVNNVQEDKETDKGGPTSSQQQQPLLDADAMSQMLYHYQQQQQLLQQRYQQQMHPYSQLQYSYFNQPAYQMLPHQQLYGQQQPIPSYQQPQQNNQQSQQGQEDPAYHLAYQQQMQQYQQYQGYHHLAGQQQSTEGPSLMQEQHNSTQNLSQNQQVPKKVLPEYDAAAESSESPHLKAQSQSTQATVS